METVKIEPREDNVGRNQHFTVWPEVGGDLPRTHTARATYAHRGASWLQDLFFIASNLELGYSHLDIK